MNQARNAQEEIDRLTELNRRLANQLVGITDRLETSRRELMAQGWDAGFKEAVRITDLAEWEIELALTGNPYRQPINPLGDPQ